MCSKISNRHLIVETVTDIVFVQINDLVCKEDQALLSKGKACAIPDLAGEAEMLEWANIGFGEQDTYRL